MKNLLWLLIIVLFCASMSAQTQYGINCSQLCWDSAGVSIPVNRLAVYTTSNKNTENLIGYFHATKGYKINAITNTLQQANLTQGYCDLQPGGGGGAVDTSYSLQPYCDSGTPFFRLFNNNTRVVVATLNGSLSGTYTITGTAIPGDCGPTQTVSYTTDTDVLFNSTAPSGTLNTLVKCRELIIYNGASTDATCTIYNGSNISIGTVTVAAYGVLAISHTNNVLGHQQELLTRIDYVYPTTLDTTPYQTISITGKRY